MKYPVHPETLINIKEQQRPAYKHSVACLNFLQGAGVITKSDHRKALSSIERWLKKYGYEAESIVINR